LLLYGGRRKDKYQKNYLKNEQNMSSILIRYIGVTLKNWAGKDEEKMVIEEPVSVTDVLHRLEERHGKMPLPFSSLIILVNGRSAKLEALLHGNETIILTPLVGGG
jgi:hypothetical protein